VILSREEWKRKYKGGVTDPEEQNEFKGSRGGVIA